MHLDLVSEDRRIEDLAGLLEQFRREIREADVADLAGLVGVVERRQNRLVIVDPRRPVDVTEVDGVDAQSLEAAVDRFGNLLRVGRDVVVDGLRREENVLAVDVARV